MTNYDGQRLCGFDDALAATGQMYKWPSPDVSWCIVADLPGFARESFKAACDAAWFMWTKVCGIRPRFVDGSSANIIIGIQTLGPGGVLADCGIPTWNSMQESLRMRVDTAEAWTRSKNPPRDKVDLDRVVAHELAHGCGMFHIARGNLLADIYSSSIFEPQSADILEMRLRYGPPSITPPPPPPPPPGEYEELFAVLKKGGSIFVRQNGAIKPA